MNFIKENINKVRQDFPLLQKTMNGKPIVYLDNAATTQKPIDVIDCISDYYLSYNANIHRGVYSLSQKATDRYEEARETIREFINAADDKEVIFVKGATEAINLVASSYGRENISENDEIIITGMEHHANIVPWQQLCNEKKSKLKIVPLNDKGEISIQDFSNAISEKTKFVSCVYVSNSLGTINPVKEIIEISHRKNIPVLIDAAQAIQHIKVDVQELDCDFLVFSGHKIYAPTGTGILYGKKNILENMPPYQTGGDMILSVTFEKTLFNDLPYKLEAGTPDIAGMIGLGSAIKYFSKYDINDIANYEKELVDYATQKLTEINEVRIIGTAENKTSVVSFYSDLVHPHDFGTLLDEIDNICVRAGHHCTQPVMDRFCIPATVRASFSFYNTFEEIDKLVSAVKKIISMFK